MATAVIELATRLLNACLGAGLGYVICFRYRAWDLLGLGIDMGSLAWTVAGALVGLIWGNTLWRSVDKYLDRRTGR